MSVERATNQSFTHWPQAVLGAGFAWQTWRIDLARPEVNFSLFLANILTGALLAGAAFVGAW
jgi:4-hydroxybenzoate polyprenyltransferase